MKILLVEPRFPIPTKSKNHKDFLPVGLLKLASYYQKNGEFVKLVRGNQTKPHIRSIGSCGWYVPDRIMITSLFTYWSEYVKDCVQYYKDQYPNVPITVGGIYASLMPDHCLSYTGCDDYYGGVHKEAEKLLPDYSLLGNDMDYQILHTSRGCIRKCDFCGTWKIEPKFKSKKTIRREIQKRKLVFYDNNLFANPQFKNILDELIELKQSRKILWCESQSGFDGRILIEMPILGRKIKKAGFRYPRIAWDWGIDQSESIRKQVKVLLDSGYQPKDIGIFMIYNWKIPFEEMEKKRIACWKWRVQISDCRYRPLDQLYDYYKPRKRNQTNKEYHIHVEAGWSDDLVKQFRRNIRRQNICVRHNFPFHSSKLERKGIPKAQYWELITQPKMNIASSIPDAWFPENITYPITYAVQLDQYSEQTESEGPACIE